MSNKKFKIATFNANSLKVRLDQVLSWLKDNDCDYLAIQETKTRDENFPEDEFRDAGYHVAYRGMKAYCGVAIASKEKPRDVSISFDDDGPTHEKFAEQDPARLIRADFKEFSLVNTYIPQGFEVGSPQYEYKLEWYERLKKYFDKHFKKKDSLVWVGDLNVAYEERDVYDPEGLIGNVDFTPEVREAFKDVMNWGFIDVVRKHHENENEYYTFWDYRRNAFKRNNGWRLDHILATKSMAERSEDVFVDREARKAERPSDHTFVVGIFK